MAIKIVFFDVDGTLASNKDHSIGFCERVPESAKTAIEALKQKGILVAIATGRSYSNVKVLEAYLGIDTIIASNGSLVMHHGEVLDGQYIPTELVYAAIEALKPIPDINILVETTRGDFMIGEPQSDLSFMGDNLPIIHNLDDLEAYDVFQVVGNGYDIAQYLDSVHPKLTLKKFGPHAFDISLKGVHKGVALDHVLKKLSLKPEHAMAFGDEENDLEMFKVAGISVAMGDSNPHLKELATFVTSDVEEAGIETALKHFGLI